MSYVQLSDLRQLDFETVLDFGRRTVGFDRAQEFGKKTAGFDRMVMTPNKAWGDDAFDARASEDAPIAMDFDSLERWGMADAGGQPNVASQKIQPTEPAKPGILEALTIPLVVGSLLALAWGAITAPAEVGRGQKTR